MSDRIVVRGDDYVSGRYLFKITLVDANLDPMDLAACTVRSTWRSAVIPPLEDEGDETAPFAASIVFDSGGGITSSSGFALPVGKEASDGELLLVMDREQSTALPLATVLRGDVQITDANDEVSTVILLNTITAIDAYTSSEK